MRTRTNSLYLKGTEMQDWHPAYTWHLWAFHLLCTAAPNTSQHRTFSRATQYSLPENCHLFPRKL